MKRLSVVSLLFIASTAHAVECGPLVQHDRLVQLEGSVREVGINLIQHSNALQSEVDGLLKYALTQATINEINRIQRDQSLLADAQTADLETALQSASTLAGIRDLMVDKRDKVIVEGFLSNSMSFVRRLAETRLRYVNQILVKMSRPGLAVDMAKLRDSVGAVFQEFARCEPRRVPVRDTKAR